MKKIFCSIAALILLAGCDDGDMTFKTFDFTGIAPAQCTADTDILYKINGTEALVLTINSATALLNAETPIGEPRSIPVGSGGTTLTYQNYSATISGPRLCGTGTPQLGVNVIDEWKGEGFLEVVTNKVTNDEGHITGYTHQITLRTITFTKDSSNEEVRITDNNFGSIDTSLGFDFDFESPVDIPIILGSCSDTGMGPFHSRKDNEALVLTLETSIINSQDTTTPIEIDLDNIEDDNELLFRVFSGVVGVTSICSLNPPVTPTETQRWTADEGTLKIVTTFSNGIYKHTVHLIDVTFTKGTAKYVVEESDFIIGSFSN